MISAAVGGTADLRESLARQERSAFATISLLVTASFFLILTSKSHPFFLHLFECMNVNSSSIFHLWPAEFCPYPKSRRSLTNDKKGTR